MDEYSLMADFLAKFSGLSPLVQISALISLSASFLGFSFLVKEMYVAKQAAQNTK